MADTTAHCLDAGCGEGYYLRKLTDYDAPDTFDQFLADLKARARQDKSPRWSIAPTGGASAAQHGGRLNRMSRRPSGLAKAHLKRAESSRRFLAFEAGESKLDFQAILRQ